jgi:hypothetical protein
VLVTLRGDAGWLGDCPWDGGRVDAQGGREMTTVTGLGAGRVVAWPWRSQDPTAGPQPGDRGGQRRRPRPGSRQAQHQVAGVADEATGGLQQPGPQSLWLGDGQLAVQQQGL